MESASPCQQLQNVGEKQGALGHRSHQGRRQKKRPGIPRTRGQAALFSAMENTSPCQQLRSVGEKLGALGRRFETWQKAATESRYPALRGTREHSVV
ncbi:hypothetical protein NDU88_005592 [Pleurodeles waltl]|uniref:Uncharacterized protein n=1 Tax=Pleurodeles waltl TaxID=8319 RepID=A0AAV7NRX1_PLEWA|nr:hypothetical protein NDU88_005592 [Pleurodeles waltl]